MKKFLYVVSAIIFCCCSNSALCEVEETTTYGTPPTNSIGLPMGTDVGGMTQHMIWGMQHNQSVQNGRSVYEEIKKQREKRCASEKGRIEGENAARLESASFDNLREVGRCQSESNTGWSFSGSGGHKILYGGVTYTVENPTYDKCADKVGALYDAAKATSFVIYTRDQNTARSANNAECADFYK